ncbi:MAG: hypothetical protein P8J32_03145 [bacterium]|nr:hypothetical protein [bacterium]
MERAVRFCHAALILEKKRAKRRIEELREKKEAAENRGGKLERYEKREFDKLRSLLKTD